jgi:hypothetical protein
MARRKKILIGVLAVAVAAAAAAALYMPGGRGPAAAGAPAEGPWGPEIQLSTGRGGFGWWGIASSGRSLHMVWGSSKIHYRRSLDEGATWSAETTLTPSGEARLTDPLAAEGSNVYVVYLRGITNTRDWCCRRRVGDVYFRRSRDGGETWEPEVRLTTAGGAIRISLAASGPRLDLVWMDLRVGNRGIYYRRSPDGGGTWDPEVRLASGDSSVLSAERPQVAGLGDSVHVVWMYVRDRIFEVFYKRSLDGGKTWGEDVRLTFDPPFSGRPDVAALAPDTVIVSWDEDRDDNGGHEQYVRRSSDNGSTWGPPVRMSFAPGSSDHSGLFAAGQTAQLAWRDRRDEKNIEVYYRVSFDGGASWEPEERVTHADGESGVPLLAATPGYGHVLWPDDRTGSTQFWYRRRKLAADPASGGETAPK